MGITGKHVQGSSGRGARDRTLGASPRWVEGRGTASTPLAQVMLGGQRGRTLAAAVVLLLLASILTSFAIATQATPAAAAPGNPGVPGTPIVLYTEDFENRPANSNTLLTNYVSDTGMTYSGSPYWTNPFNCNGFIINYNSPRGSATECNGGGTNGVAAFNALTAVPFGLGKLIGLTDAQARANAAASSYTAGNTTANGIQFRTVDQLTLPTANRFVTFSVDAGATSCQATHPQLRFYLLDDQGLEHPVSQSAIDPCTASNRQTINVTAPDGTVRSVSSARVAADSSMLLQGTSLGIVMRNENGSGVGNDGAYDNIRVLDVTPQLDKSFSPRSVPVGGVSRLTLTVTNTSELAAKPGWSGTDVLEDGLVVANPGNASTTCSNGSVDAAAGSDTIDFSGDLRAGQASCTISVDVTSTVPATAGNPNRFENCASNFPTLVGLNPPACADVEFYEPVADITPTKSVSPESGTTVSALQQLTYTLSFANSGEASGTIDYTDHLADILDDADITSGPTSSAASVTAAVSGDTLSVTGSVPAGDTVSVTYTVTVGSDGARGNDHLGNFLVLGDEEPPTECAADSDLCTENPVKSTAWSCTSYGYLFQSPNANTHDMFQVDLVSGVATRIGSTTSNVNAVGYNTLDNYMYGWKADTPRGLVRIAADGSLTDLGIPAGMPGTSFQVGDFDDAGHLLLQYGGDGTGAWAQIDLAPGSATYGEILASGTATRPAGIGALPSDWAFVDGAYYGLANTAAGTGAARLVRFVPATNTYTVVAAVAGTQSSATYGAAYADAAGNLYFSNNTTGNIYRVDPATGASILVSNGPVSTGNDGARCATAPIPTVTVMKTVEGRVLPADQFTVGLTRANGTSLASATTTGTDTTVSTTDWPVSQGLTYRVTDAMAAGSGSALSAYTATVECTDTVTGRTFPVGGTTAQWTFTVPGQSAYLCEVTNTAIAPTFSIAKTASVDTAAPGDVVTYEVTLTNTGTAPFTDADPASFSDDLSGVLDDATYNGDASGGAVVDGTDLTWSGPLAIGETKTITYSVTVDSPPGGDKVLTNTVVPGENGACDPEDSCVTDTPIGELHDWKTVETSTTPAEAGSTLTYTLHFENRGPGSVDVDRVDDLTHVLDDADVTSEPVATGGLTATRSGSRIAITGTLAAGASATVTYVVTVKPDASRSGDDIALNFLLDPDEQPPAPPSCDPASASEPDCTTTPIENDYPDVTCASDPNIFNTGYNEATNGQMPNGSQDPRWTVTGGYSGAWGPNGTTPATAAPLPPAGSVFVPARVGKVNNAWADSPYGNAQWISASAPDATGQNQATNSYGDWYYRYQFNLAPEVDPDSFSLTMNWLADNAVMAVWVNGQTQTGENLPQTTTDPYAHGGFYAENAAQTTMQGHWRTGQNTILVLIKSYYTAEGFDAYVEPSALCPDPTFSVEKSASVENAEPGDTVTYDITVTNTGNTAFTDADPASFSDDLSGVLDDATYNGDASGGAVVDGTDLTWSGPLAIGETKTITYSVTVDSPPGGDKVLTNTVVPGENGACDPEDSCVTDTPIGELHDWKTVEASESPVAAGTQLTYTLHFENRGEAAVEVDRVDDLSQVLDDADVTTEPSSDVLTATRNGSRIAITGSLEPGASTTVTYTVTLKADGDRGDDLAANFLLDLEDTPPTEPVCQPTDAEEPDCTITPIGRLSTAKSVEASSDPVVAGTTLTYTLTFDNQGKASVPVDYTDLLAGVLDDADVTSLPESSDPALVVSPIIDGSLTVTGDLAAGQTVTVAYVVTVKDEADRGDDMATNFLVETGEEPPAECVDGDANCTETPMPNVTPTKSVDPASGTGVKAGDVLTYTLTFVNDGTAAGPIDYTDYLADVLDDAELTGGPTSSDAAVTAVTSSDTIDVTGTIEPGSTITVEYSVTVGADGARGDDHLGNFPVEGDDVPPAECEVGDPLCTENPVGSISTSKAVEVSSDPVVTGTELTYTLTFTNDGRAPIDVSRVDDLTGVLDDATVTTQPTSSSDDLTASEVTDGKITISGIVAAGETVTVTYAVTVNAEDARGDDTADNFLLLPGEEPPADCVEGDPNCTVTPLPHVTPSKSVDPASGTSVAAGDVLTYTLSFVNDGTAAGPVDDTDHLGDILDDATITDGPTSSDAGVTATLDGETIAVSGTIAAGATVTVTYQVTVGADGERGDNNLGNFLVPGDEEPPTECVEGSALCTENPIGELHDWKTVEASETPVAAGTELTYTLHFENTGEGTVDVNSIDFLNHVLDDADVTAEPTSDDLTVTRDGESITITGSLEPGQSATVVYTVTVKADGARGDDTASNFLVKNDDPGNPPTPPTDPTCEPTDSQEPDCTTTPIGSYTAVKTVTPNETPIGVGTILAYTLTFTNDSAAAAEVDETDTLTGVLDDATLVDSPTSSSDALAVSDVTDGAFRITGTLAPGETVTVAYTVSVNPESARGDNVAANTLLPTDGDDECTPERCTETPLPVITPAKSVDPADGSTVAAGDVLTYTLTFANDSDTDGSIEYTDVLTDLLDDATVTGQPASSSDDVTATLDGDSILIEGAIAAGETVTVTYQVTVLPDGERGDNIIGNVVVPEGEDPPGPDDECAEGDPLCTTNPVGELHDWKTVEASETPVAAGTELTYTLHFENRGEGTVDVNSIDFLNHVLDDADVTAEPASDVLTATRDGETITITGSLGAGETATVVYTVTVRADSERGDDTASNFLVENDDPGNPPTPPTDPVCQPTDAEEPDCTVTPIGRLDTSKAVSASSDPIEAGTLLSYTLTFDNQSDAAVEVDRVDDLAGVLDDADVTTEPVSSDDALTATRDGSTISVRGTLEPGQTVMVVYVVTVKEESERGDDVADNFLLNPGEEPPAECADGDPNCTVTPLPNIESSKAVDPGSGTTVLPGDVLTYTLSLTNSGEAAGAVHRIDYLAGVLDDAEWTDGPTVSDPSVTAVLDGTDLVIGGSLEPGQTVTVTYTVTVLPDAARGDDLLSNFLLDTDEEPPGPDTECEEGDSDCTVNYVPRIVDSKSADPVSGTPIAAGQKVTYTLTFRNEGTAAGAVSKDDVMAGVLDDADLTTAPTASSDALTVSELTDGRIHIGGTLEPGESATVTYSVTVRPFAEQGDHMLGNWLVLPGETPPADCTVDMSTARAASAEDPDCTVHPIGEIAATKSVDPQTGTSVEQGQVLRYTLTFTNTGTGQATVDYTDHLGDVLDDATITSGPSSDTGSVESDLDGSTLTIGGTLAAGATAKVTYSVTVMAYDRQGNHQLDNFLGLSGGDPQESCVADDPLCTSNPVSPPPPLAITGGEVGLGALALMILLILGGVLAIETSRRRRLLGAAESFDTTDRTS